jgi:DNA-binding SARP family transcriptional activator
MAVPNGPEPTVALSLLGRFALRCDDHEVTTPLAVQRLLAFLALKGRALPRHFVAGSLWSEVPEARASANLRATIWRATEDVDVAIDVSSRVVGLRDRVVVDHQDALDQTHGLITTPSPDVDGDRPWTCPQAADVAQDLLPGWSDEWVVAERERLRQLRLHALESMCERYLTGGRPQRAIEVGLVAIASGPHRESAHRGLIRAHLANGDPESAVRVLEDFRTILGRDLGLRPSPMIEALAVLARSPA